MTNQMSIFDVPVALPSDKPCCRMCSRPARWLQTQQRYAMYCAGAACNNRERKCQSCGQQFTINVDGAGTKYCSVPCKESGYRVGKGMVATQCAWCGRRAHQARARLGQTWPYICRTCLDPLRHVEYRLKKHHVNHQRARRLLEDPGCEICGRDLLAKTRDLRTGAIRVPLTVDHDHRCCPGENSCGQCVRGLLCAQCNAAVGLLQDTPENAVRLAGYLARGMDGPAVREVVTEW